MELITVIIPVYNGSNFSLSETLQSVYAQKYNNLNVIIVNDASTDNSSEIIKKYSKGYEHLTKVIEHKKNMGLSKSWNDAISEVVEGYIILLQQDCKFYDSETVSKLASEFHNTDSESVIVGRPFYDFNALNFWQILAEIRFSRITENELNSIPLYVRFTANKCDFLSLTTFKTIGKFCEKLPMIGQDWFFSQVAVYHGIKLFSASFPTYLNNMLGENSFLKLLRKESAYAKEVSKIKKQTSPIRVDPSISTKVILATKNSRNRLKGVIFSVLLIVPFFILFSMNFAFFSLTFVVILSSWFVYYILRLGNLKKINQIATFSAFIGAAVSIILDVIYTAYLLLGIFLN